MMKQYYVYIMTNESRTLYAGVTNDLNRRIYEHRHQLIPGFCSKYQIKKLVYYETTQDIHAAAPWSHGVDSSSVKKQRIQNDNSLKSSSLIHHHSSVGYL